MLPLSVVIALSLLLAMPIALAAFRNCKSFWLIVALTVLSGWTGFGWLAAFLWAATGHVRARLPEQMEIDKLPTPFLQESGGPRQAEDSVPPLSAPNSSSAPKLVGAASSPGQTPFPSAPGFEDRPPETSAPTLKQISANLEEWRLRAEDAARRKAPDAGGLAEAYDALRKAADHEVRRRAKAKAHAETATAAEPAATSYPGFDLHYSKQGRPYYRNCVDAPPDGYRRLRAWGLGGAETRGWRYYQDHLDQIAGGRKDAPVYFRTFALIRAEPENAHDPNAVVLEVNGSPIAHIPREEARAYRDELESLGAPGIFSCDVTIESGLPEWRVTIDVLRPLELQTERERPATNRRRQLESREAKGG